MSSPAIDLNRLPLHVRDRAELMLGHIAQGQPLRTLGGRRMNFDRHRASIPIGLRWRLLVDEVGGRLVPRAVLSHEAYNKRKQR